MIDDDGGESNIWKAVSDGFNRFRESPIISWKPNGIVARIVEDTRFEYFIQFFIIVNSICLGTQYHDQPEILTKI